MLQRLHINGTCEDSQTCGVHSSSLWESRRFDPAYADRDPSTWATSSLGFLHGLLTVLQWHDWSFEVAFKSTIISSCPDSTVTSHLFNKPLIVQDLTSFFFSTPHSYSTRCLSASINSLSLGCEHASPANPPSPLASSRAGSPATFQATLNVASVLLILDELSHYLTGS